MNPLALHFLAVLKNEATRDTRRYLEHERALEEMGYWVLTRPRWCERGGMPPCQVSETCRWVEAFPSAWSGEDVMIDVYVDPLVADDAEGRT